MRRIAVQTVTTMTSIIEINTEFTGSLAEFALEQHDEECGEVYGTGEDEGGKEISIEPIPGVRVSTIGLVETSWSEVAE